MVSETEIISRLLTDEYGNQHCLAGELASGGQGVVYRTKDVDLAIKQPIKDGELDRNIDLHKRFRQIRLLPIPPRIPISLPLAILKDEPGYVMRLLNGMAPFEKFDLNGKTKNKLEEENLILPQWLSGSNKALAMQLIHYANTGSTRSRLFALAKCAAILARIHSAGLVYGDISTNNAFIGEDKTDDVWLIDADNMRFEMLKGGITVYTPHYGAPEVVNGVDASRPRTDCWAFAVMAFKLLALCHPFIGKKVLEPEEEESGWDDGSAGVAGVGDLDEQAYAGRFPFIDDENDDSNQLVGTLPRVLVATEGIRRLFQETFGEGRLEPHYRPTMAFWALELMKAFDLSLECRECKMSYFVPDFNSCPYCRKSHQGFVWAKTPRWKIVIPGNAKKFALPHRLFNPFSFQYNDETTYEAEIEFASGRVLPVRGTKPFPDDLVFEFIGAGR